MANPTRAASTSQSRAWVVLGRDLVADHVAVVVEAVEPVGELAHPGRDLVRRPLGAGQRHHLGQARQRAQQLDLALVGQERQVDVGESARAPRPASPAFLPIEWMRAWAYCT